MALLSVAVVRWRERLRAWLDEYYWDNPLVWGMHRHNALFSRTRMNSPRWHAPPLWTRARTLWAILWWTVAVLCLWGMHLDPMLKHQAQQWLERHASTVLIWLAFGFVFYLRVGSVTELLGALREAKQLIMLSMTRLRGTHVVYGSVFYSWLQGTLMRTLIAYLPLLWVVHWIFSENVLIALGTAAVGVLGWNGIVLALVLMGCAVLPVEPSVREASAGKASSGLSVATYIVLGLGLIIVAPSLVVILLMPLRYFLMLLTPVAWGLALLLRMPAVRRAEHLLRSKEAEIVPSEGRWQ